MKTDNEVKKVLTVLTLSVLLTACGGSTPPKLPTVVDLAKDKIKSRVKDPSSVQFQITEESAGIDDKHTLGCVSGEFNAKNSFGAYTGFQYFTFKVNAYGNGWLYTKDSRGNRGCR